MQCKYNRYYLICVLLSFREQKLLIIEPKSIFRVSSLSMQIIKFQSNLKSLKIHIKFVSKSAKIKAKIKTNFNTTKSKLSQFFFFFLFLQELSQLPHVHIVTVIKVKIKVNHSYHTQLVRHKYREISKFSMPLWNGLF